MPRRIEIRSDYFSDEECSNNDDDSYSYTAHRSDSSLEDYEQHSDEDGFDIPISKSNHNFDFKPEPEPEPENISREPYIVLGTYKEVETNPRGWGWMMPDYPKTILRLIPTEGTRTPPPSSPPSPSPPSSPPPSPAPIWTIMAPVETKSVVEILSEQEKEKQHPPRRDQPPRRLLHTNNNDQRDQRDQRDRRDQPPRRLLHTNTAAATPQNRSQQPSPPPTSSRGNNGVAKPELLCIHGPTHVSSKSCNMAHKWTQWEPKTCRFSKCRSGAGCIFWHKQSETLQQYFQRSLQNQGSFFFKNKDVYLKNYPI